MMYLIYPLIQPKAVTLNKRMFHATWLPLIRQRACQGEFEDLRYLTDLLVEVVEIVA